MAIPFMAAGHDGPPLTWTTVYTYHLSSLFSATYTATYVAVYEAEYLPEFHYHFPLPTLHIPLAWVQVLWQCVSLYHT